MRIVFILLFFFFFTFFIYPQSFYFRHFTIENGLSQSQVNSICQDKKGNIWFGTNGGGANKYDGKSFYYYTTKNGLADNVVRKIFEDSRGNIWYATSQGLTRFDGISYNTFTTADMLESNSISALMEDKKGNLWIGTGNGLNIFDGKKFSSFSEKHNELSKSIFDIFQDSRGVIWIITNQSEIWKFSGDTLILFNYFNIQKPYHICEDYHGNLWITSLKGGVYKYDGYHIKEYSTNNGFTSYPSYSLFTDRFGIVWIGTWVGLFRYNKSSDTFTLFSTKEGLGNNQVMSINQDKEGNLWLATNGGADMFPPPLFTNYTVSDGLLDNLVFAITADRQGNMWFGTSTGLSKFDSKMQVSSDVFKGSLTKAVFEDSFNRIYNGTGGGLGIFEASAGKSKVNYTHSAGFIDVINPNASFTQIIEDRFQNLWLATYGYGVYKILKDRKTIINYTMENGLCDNTVRSLFEDEKGIIWFGTGSGKLCSFDGKKFNYFDEKDGLTNQRILSIICDDKKNLWFGGYSGICKYDGKKFNWITDADGLATNTIYSLLYDDKKYLWIGSIRGLDRVDVEEYNKNGKVVIRHYGKEEGFTGVECNPGAAFKDRAGNLWFGTIKGLFKYNPDNDKINEIPPQTHINSLRLFFENVNWAEYTDSLIFSTGLPLNLILPFDKNHLTFDFSAISLTVPEKVRYQYKLTGLDKKWSPEMSENSITYSNLSPGEYTFNVKACNNDGIWNTEPASFHFVITPPFWKTWWFYFICVAATIGSITFYSRLREKKLRRQKEILEQRVKLRTREIDNQKKIIEEKNKDIMDSIQYAKCIQEAMLPARQNILKVFPESFVFYQPKDIVSGDFYWLNFSPANDESRVNYYEQKDASALIAIADCTGHGVPGAFMSMIGSSQLTQIVVEKKITTPSDILRQLNRSVKQALQSQGGNIAKDGMDIALLKISGRLSSSGISTKKIEFAGANRPLYIIRKEGQGRPEENTPIEKSMMVVNPDKTAIGGFTDVDYAFKNNEIEIWPGDKIYLFSDGFADQFGGQKKKKFMTNRFKELLFSLSHEPMNEQEKILRNTINEWKGDLDQVDDWLVLGISV